MRRLFDYIFFQAYRWFVYRKDEGAEFKAMLTLSFIQFATLLNGIGLVFIIFNIDKPPRFVGTLPMLLIGLINYLIYLRNFDSEKIRKQFENISKSHLSRDGWLMILCGIVAIIGIGILGAVYSSSQG